MNKLCRSVLLSVGVGFLMAGCASGPGYKEVASSIPTLSTSHGRIYVFRSRSVLGAALQPEVKLNGQVVGKSQPGGFFYIDEPAGQYVISTATETEKTVSFNLDAGETKYVRTGVSLGIAVGRVVPSLEVPDVATKEIEGLNYTGAQSTAQK